MELRQWYSAFWSQVRKYPWADGLKEAAISEKLKEWTDQLTKLLIYTFEQMKFKTVARGSKSDALPVSRQEYLGIDLLVFPNTNRAIWRKPIIAFELENGREINAIAYALWKICMVRVEWGAIFCYREDSELIGYLLRYLTDNVMKPIRPEHDILLIVGTRSKADNFPDGFFRPYIWEKDILRFRQF